MSQERFRTKEQILVTVKTLAEFGDQRLDQMKDELAEEKKLFGRDDRTRIEMANYFSKVLKV